MDYKKLFLAVVGALTIMLVGFGFASGVFYLAIHVPYVIGPIAALAVFLFLTRALYRSIRVEDERDREIRTLRKCLTKLERKSASCDEAEIERIREEIERFVLHDYEELKEMHKNKIK